MHAADVFHGAAEQELPGAETLETGQDIDFLQMEQVTALPLDRNVAARLAVGRGDEPDVADLKSFLQEIKRT